MPAWTSTGSACRRTASLLAYRRASSEAAATQQGWIACGPLPTSANDARKATRSLSRSASVMFWSPRPNVARYACAMKGPLWAAKNPSWILSNATGSAAEMEWDSAGHCYAFSSRLRCKS